jgi:hypothetical protein
MDIAAIREDLAHVMQAAGYNSTSYVNPDPSGLPAMFSGLPTSMVPLTTRKWVMTMPVTLLFSLADAQDAQRRLDTALSPGVTGSVYDALKDATGCSWDSLRYVNADDVREVVLGESRALACDITIEITG